MSLRGTLGQLGSGMDVEMSCPTSGAQAELIVELSESFLLRSIELKMVTASGESSLVCLIALPEALQVLVNGDLNEAHCAPWNRVSADVCCNSFCLDDGDISPDGDFCTIPAESCLVEALELLDDGSQLLHFLLQPFVVFVQSPSSSHPHLHLVK